MDTSNLTETIDAAKVEAIGLQEQVNRFSIEEDYCRRYEQIARRVEALKIRYSAMIQARNLGGTGNA